MNPKLTAERLARGAIVYVRQSTPGQVLHHRESQRRQYALEDHARQLGFQQVVVLDEDLGRSGSGMVERTGFQQLVGAVCAGAVGAVFCIEASRLARNGREWHHLIELCGLAGTVIVDPDGIYDPGVMNDRLLLGLKGTMSEELQYRLPVGYLWTADGRMEKDPDQRVQQTLSRVFSKMIELGSVRQVLLWFRGEGMQLPRRIQDQPGGRTIWGPAIYSALLKLYVTYSGRRAVVLRYQCKGAHMRDGGERRLSFSGKRVDQAVSDEILRAIGGNAVEAAVEAAEKMKRHAEEQRRSVELEWEQARYQAKLSARRYEAVDPDNRLVAAELEVRWNTALKKARELEDRLRDFDVGTKRPAIPDKEILLSLAQDLPAVWNAASSETGLKQRIVRILVEEVVADVDEEKQEIVLLIHWAGGRHSELRVNRNGTGHHGRSTGLEAIEVIGRMCGRFADGEIAATLNRLGLRTGAGNSWNAQRVYALRRNHDLPNNRVSPTENNVVTLQEAADRLRVSPSRIRRMIEQRLLPATQVIACAPWEIPIEALNAPTVQQALNSTQTRARPRTQQTEGHALLFSESS